MIGAYSYFKMDKKQARQYYQRAISSTHFIYDRRFCLITITFKNKIKSMVFK